MKHFSVPFRVFFLFLPLCSLLVLLNACRPAGEAEPTRRAGEAELRATVLAPAGSSVSLAWNPEKEAFEPEKEARLDFLPYPCNYGFLPGTRAAANDPRPLEVLILGLPQEAGSEVGILPIGLMRLREGSRPRAIVLAQPSDPSERGIKALRFLDFIMEYDGAKRILETWVLHHKGYGSLEWVDWQDEQFALEEIKRYTR